ncbi:MAG: sugar ABC transporter substrate-binding protein [Bradyrhizobium sp.]|nr:MAG: sugar ABC transporter substrate-binding protein [Bradyrhizobium sp.]
MNSYPKSAVAAATLFALMALSSGAALASSNKIALMPGGPHPYFAPWEQAAADAKKDFGIGDVQYKVPAEWKLDLQTELMESLATQGYVGFGFFPGDAVGINSTLQELSANGGVSAALAGCAQDPTKAAFCLGTDVYKAAYVGAQALIKAMGGKGRIVHLAGLVIDPNTKLRMAAIEKAVGETNGAVTLVQHITDLDAQEAADQKINALLGAQKDQIDGLIATAYIPSTVAAKALRNLGDKRIKLIGMDDDKIVLDGIRDGFVAGTMAQNAYGQGYIGAYALDLLASGCKVKDDAPFQKTPQTAKFIDSGTVLIQKANVDTYADDLKKVTAEIQGGFKAKFLACK